LLGLYNEIVQLICLDRGTIRHAGGETTGSADRGGEMKQAFLAAALMAALTIPGAAQTQAGTSLGNVTLSRQVMADGKPLPAGTYQLRLSEDRPEPAVGLSPDSARYIEFVRGGKVIGREVATVIPQTEVAEVADGPRPAAGGVRVELLKGNDYLRIWVNRGGNNYLIHLPVSAS
jgi:hypothetical protein